ncbi:NAD-dependent epimerase/dehydratase family protein [Paramagnetospirillum magneticum]|nr:NAD-dependent epimerase/dehydratase family protein [Paramagnetospirillum magneticum]
MNIVVTGGAGFIGSTLVRRLLDLGCSVSVIDDLSGGREENLPNHPGVTLHRLRIGTDTADQVEAVVADADMVYHLASPIGVALAHQARYEVVENILSSGIAVVRACKAHRRPLVLTSSSEIYGGGLPRPLREADPSCLDIAPRWGYASAKMALEQMGAGLCLEHGVPVWLIRPFNIAGIRQRSETGLVVASFVAAAMQNRPLDVHGDGSQLRSFLHVEDAADALMAVTSAASLAGRPINIGSESPITIGALARLVLDIVGSASPIIQTPYDDMFDGLFTHATSRIPDIGLIKGATDWRPHRSLDDAIRDCWRGMADDTPRLPPTTVSRL